MSSKADRRLKGRSLELELELLLLLLLLLCARVGLRWGQRRCDGGVIGRIVVALEGKIDQLLLEDAHRAQPRVSPQRLQQDAAAAPRGHASSWARLEVFVIHGSLLPIHGHKLSARPHPRCEHERIGVG